jgi:short-subunit dehydrogenase
MPNLAGKTALVTGASSGIGLAITKTLLDQQCQVIGMARDFNKIDFQHELLTTHSLDLSDLEGLSRLIKKITAQQHIDFFIHSAGSGRFGSIEQFSVKDINHYITSNLTSALVLSHHVVPAMRKNKSGRIIFMGSESALNAGKKSVLYSSAKFAIRGLATSLREDCSKDNINVSLINPGMVRTAFFEQQGFEPGPDPSNAIEAQDIADMVLHILYSNPNITFDEINLSPRNKTINFKKN